MTLFSLHSAQILRLLLKISQEDFIAFVSTRFSDNNGTQNKFNGGGADQAKLLSGGHPDHQNLGTRGCTGHTRPSTEAAGCPLRESALHCANVARRGPVQMVRGASAHPSWEDRIKQRSGRLF